MSKKYDSAKDMKSPKSPKKSPELGFVTWTTDEERVEALKTSASALEEYRGVEHASAGRYKNNFHLVTTNISGRPGFGRDDYNAFRPGEAVPEKHAEIIQAANDAYHRVGLVRNIIDLMGDFACQGVRLSHPNKRIEKFFNNWFARVSGPDRSERFLNNLYRTGNVVIRKSNARLSKTAEKQLFKSIADAEVSVDMLKVRKREIPWRYTFLDPITISVIGGALSSFVGEKRYAITIPSYLRKIINSPDKDEKALISKLPKELIKAAKSGQAYPLPEDKTMVFHYKKDDWMPWAHPMIYAVLDDIFLLEKLKLADVAALDGAISNIRIFKLGNLEHRIAPTPAAASKLADILENNVGGGTTDLVWGPDIELLESKTSVHQFLGQEKYVPTLNAIYAGLGIPPSLTGINMGGGGLTNNFMSLKTLIERLEYGRNILLSFWNKEIIAVQKAMGFRFPANVEFDQMTLANEDAEKSLLIQLADRNLVSDETLQRKFGDNPEMEKIRINREHRDRNNDKTPDKAGPYHDANTDSALKKLALQTGIVTPSEVGLDLDDRQDGQKPALEMREQQKNGPNNQKKEKQGAPGEGRPKNSKDSSPREPRKSKPSSPNNKLAAMTQLWAKQTQSKISKIVNPLLLEHYKKKNMRSLSSTETNEAEMIRFSVLCNLSSFCEVDYEAIKEALNKKIPIKAKETYSDWQSEFVLAMGRQPILDELRDIQANIYSLLFSQ